MSEPFTISSTEVYSEADVKAVMKNTYEDIIGFANRKLVGYSEVKKWIEDLIYILNKGALKSFEIQLYNSSGERFKSYKYAVNESGFLTSGSTSGGISYFDIPNDTKIHLFAELNESKDNTSAVRKVLVNERGWGTNGTPMEGNLSFDRTYASNNLQLKRYSITK